MGKRSVGIVQSLPSNDIAVVGVGFAVVRWLSKRWKVEDVERRLLVLTNRL